MLLHRKFCGIRFVISLLSSNLPFLTLQSMQQQLAEMKQMFQQMAQSIGTVAGPGQPPPPPVQPGQLELSSELVLIGRSGII